jgi:hypothetical protein
VSISSVSERLARLFDNEVVAWTFPASIAELAEPRFTGDHLYERAKSFVETLNRKSLLIRADGHVAPWQLRFSGMSFVPDLEIVEFERRHLAVEVKFIREVDPSGSITKAMGQVLLYKSLGFEQAHALIVDTRLSSNALELQRDVEKLLLPDGITCSVFVRNAIGTFCAVQKTP